MPNYSFSAIFSPASEQAQGRVVNITVSATYATPVMIEIWGYNAANVMPTSQLGWAQISRGVPSGTTVQWDTTQWSLGSHAIAFVIRDSKGIEIATWLSQNDVPYQTPLTTYKITKPGAIAVPGNMNTLLLIGAVAVAVVVGAKLLAQRG